MPEAATFAVFVGAALALLLTPGPAVLYIVARSVDQGVRAGIVSAMGLVVGGAVHVMAAVVGISALLAATPAALVALTWAGAAYLAWLGFSEIRARAAPDGNGGNPTVRPAGAIFRQGVVVSLLNPKAFLFFMAFLPQFVRRDGADPRLQVLALGATFLGLAVCTDSAWALAAGKAGTWLRGPGRERIRRRVSATVYFVLAAGAVWPRG